MGRGHLYIKFLPDFFFFLKADFGLAAIQLWRYFIPAGYNMDHKETLAVFCQIIQEKAHPAMVRKSRLSTTVYRYDGVYNFQYFLGNKL